MHFGVLLLGPLLTSFGLFGVVVLRRVYSGAYSLAGGPTAAGSSAFLGRGLSRIRNRRLGGRAAGTVSSRRYRVSLGDDVDVHCAQYFVHSSLSPVLLFRGRRKSVADVLHGIRSKGFTQTRWGALLRYWSAVCRHGPCGPITSLHPWDDWIPPDLHGFFKWVFDSLDALNGFLRQVVVSRRDDKIHRWTWWLREDLSSRHYVWLRPDFVPPSPFLVVKGPLELSHLGFWLNLILLMLCSARPGWIFSAGLAILLLLLISSWIFGGHLLPQEPYLELPRISGRDFQEVGSC